MGPLHTFVAVHTMNTFNISITIRFVTIWIGFCEKTTRNYWTYHFHHYFSWLTYSHKYYLQLLEVKAEFIACILLDYNCNGRYQQTFNGSTMLYSLPHAHSSKLSHHSLECIRHWFVCCEVASMPNWSGYLCCQRHYKKLCNVASTQSEVRPGSDHNSVLGIEILK